MRVCCHSIYLTVGSQLISQSRIVEYATREQAQNAVNTLSNQNLMGRLVYVREVWIGHFIISSGISLANRTLQDREAEPRFIGGPPRNDFGGGGGRGGFGGGFGGPPVPRHSVYVANVCYSLAFYLLKSTQGLLTGSCSFHSKLPGKK